jgi:hypothetical protein
MPSRSKITGSYVNPAFSKTEAMLNGFDEAIVLTRTATSPRARPRTCSWFATAF